MRPPHVKRDADARLLDRFVRELADLILPH